MKKTAFLLSLLLLLSACGGPAAVRFEPERSFTLDFTLETGDYTIEGTLDCRAYDDLRLSFTHPALLGYFTVRYSSEGYLTDVAGAGDEIAARQVPTLAPVRVFCEAVRAAVFTQTPFTLSSAGEYETQVPVGNVTVTVTFGQDGMLREIVCAETKLRVTFES
jgi:hypothetical protein